MKIYKMTATFGKLEHETLTLEPGLNVIHAPNEWGKSTWCAFLAAMLYGLDTRAKSTKTALADKERYAPWSGSPMAGRMDLNWNGRDITIERTTKRRIPLGEFRAYETATGLAVPELTGENCGRMLLGVEQSVFRRAGFIRLNHMPVTADEQLRRRLNALVTTGDENDDAEQLARQLRELKNRCRYNRTGLIPQVENQREELESKLQELEALECHSRELKTRLRELNGWLRRLENHRAALAYEAAEADAARVAQARDAQGEALARLEELENRCRALPSQEEAVKKQAALAQLQENWMAAQSQLRQLPEEPAEPELSGPFAGMDLARAEEMLGTDRLRYERLTGAKPQLALALMAAAFLVLAAVALMFREIPAAAFGAVMGIGFLIPALVIRSKWKKEAAALAEKYGTPDTEAWGGALEKYRQETQRIATDRAVLQEARAALEARLAELEKKRQSLCGAQEPEQAERSWQQVSAQWEQYYAACREARQWEQHVKALTAMVKPVKKPEFSDDLTDTEEETAAAIAEARQEQQRLQNRLGQYQGRMEALGEPEQLQQELDRVKTRLEKLEDTYAALTIALETLNEAKLELQRRFAPRIAQRAQELLGILTGGRYDRLRLEEDFSLCAGAEGEDVLQSVLWRSDGTVDQLYLALRLAVAEELTPNAPLVLDDALARFDEERMKAAMELLKKAGQNRQVILFSCQKREQETVK